MDTMQRRMEMLDLLQETEEPVTGTDLAARFGVSRQVIVQDIALLRASGEQILATPQGYIVPKAGKINAVRAVIACRHNSGQMESELGLIVDMGGRILDVIVEHPLYGEMRGNLMITSRRDVQIFMQKVMATQAQPLSVLTDGVHLHTIEAPSEAIVLEIRTALQEAGFLAG